MSVEAVGENKYRLFWELPRGIDGKRRRDSKVFRGNYEDALKEWRRRQVEIDAGRYQEPSQMTVRQLAERWLDSLASSELDVSTLEWYDRLLRVHIIPDMGDAKVQKVTAAALQIYYKAKLLPGGRRDKKPGGLSKRTVKALHAILHMMFQKALRWEIVARNVAELVDVPGERPKEARFWNDEEAARFLSAIEGHRLFALWALAILTGLRQGELLALRWAEVDLDGRALTVRRAMKRTKDKSKRVGLPKSENSRRVISLDETAAALLRAHKARQNEERLRYGADYEQNDLLFATRQGRPLSPRNVLRLHYQLCAKAGVPEIHFHEGTRHTHATLLYGAGADDKTVQSRLGHSSASFTKQVYIHALKPKEIAAAEEVGRLLLGKKKPSAK